MLRSPFKADVTLCNRHLMHLLHSVICEHNASTIMLSAAQGGNENSLLKLIENDFVVGESVLIGAFLMRPVALILLSDKFYKFFYGIGPSLAVVISTASRSWICCYLGAFIIWP